VVRSAIAALEASNDQRNAIEAAALLVSKLARSKELLLDMEALDAVAVVTTALHNDSIAAEGDPYEDTDRRPTIKALALALRSLLRARLCVCARAAAAEAEKSHRATGADSAPADVDAALQRSSACSAIFRGDSRYLSLSARSMVENVYVLEACVDSSRFDVLNVLKPFRDIVRKAVTVKQGVRALIQSISRASHDRPCDTLIGLLECLELFALHPCTSETFIDTFVAVTSPGHSSAQRTMHAAEVLVSASNLSDIPASAAISAVFCALLGAFQPPLPSSVRTNNSRVVDSWGLTSRLPSLFAVAKDTFQALVDRILVHSVLPFFISHLDTNQPQQAWVNESRHSGDITALNAFICRAMCALCRSPQIHGLLSASSIRHVLSDMSRDKNSSGSDLVSSYEKQRGGSFERALRAGAQSLLSALTGRNEESVAKEAACAALDRMDKAAIAESTVIRYDPRELLLLIHHHLVHSGLTNAAAALAQEAGSCLFFQTAALFFIDVIRAEISESLDESRRPVISRDEVPPARPLVFQSPRTPRSLCIKPRPARDTSHSPPSIGGAVGPAWLFSDGGGMASHDSPSMPAPSGGGSRSLVERERSLPPLPPPEPPKTLDSIVISHLREQVRCTNCARHPPPLIYLGSTGIARIQPAYVLPCHCLKRMLVHNR
jgi:hypothetical protein